MNHIYDKSYIIEKRIDTLSRRKERESFKLNKLTQIYLENCILSQLSVYHSRTCSSRPITNIFYLQNICPLQKSEMCTKSIR